MHRQKSGAANLLHDEHTPFFELFCLTSKRGCVWAKSKVEKFWLSDATELLWSLPKIQYTMKTHSGASFSAECASFFARNLHACWTLRKRIFSFSPPYSNSSSEKWITAMFIKQKVFVFQYLILMKISRKDEWFLGKTLWWDLLLC